MTKPAISDGFVPTIDRVDPSVVRPRWSVMIPTYHCAGYLRRTLLSVLAQDPGSELMHIDVVDDASTDDDPESVVREVGRGRVGFFRQPRNVGHVANFNTCLQRSRGHLVHLLHGDDLVRSGFYDAMTTLFDHHPYIGAAYSGYTVIDETDREIYRPDPPTDRPGLLPDALRVIAAYQPIQPPAVVVRRRVYEEIGGFDRRMASCGEDWEMWVRIACLTGFGHVPATLAEYRSHQASLTSRSLRTGQNMRDLRRAVRIYSAYLPANASACPAIARDKAARWALMLARRLAAAGDYSAARVQVREAWRTTSRWRTRRAAAATRLWTIWRRIRRRDTPRRKEANR